MSDLHEHCETLLGRGMPEHPRVTINSGHIRMLIGDGQWLKVSGVGDMSLFESAFTLHPDGEVTDLLPVILAATGHLEPTWKGGE